MTKKHFLIPLAFIFISAFPVTAFADEPLSTMRIKTDFNIWKVNLKKSNWINEYSKSSWLGLDIKLPENLEDDLGASVKPLITDSTQSGLDSTQIRLYLDEVVAHDINREKQDVTIDLDSDGNVIFEGFALKGQEIDYEAAYNLFKTAYQTGQEDVRLPIKVIDPVVNVKSDDLKQKGIISLISTGETDFSGSPYNRTVNINVGLNSFNGKLIPPGGESGAGDILGRVDGTTGYLQELVIKGDKTIPEYGGGLCQVSTTVYRSLLFGGFPITQRRNHSYAVSYYDPQGLDATIYPPTVDMKFKNDTTGHILIQTVTTPEHKAYSNIYGTPLNRHIDLIGPYYYDYAPIPAPRVEYTTKLPPGKKEILGGAHAGFKASWYRRISYDEASQPDAIEHIYSDYQARPLYTLIGTSDPQSNVSDNGT